MGVIDRELVRLVVFIRVPPTTYEMDAAAALKRDAAKHTGSSSSINEYDHILEQVCLRTGPRDSRVEGQVQKRRSKTLQIYFHGVRGSFCSLGTSANVQEATEATKCAAAAMLKLTQHLRREVHSRARLSATAAM